MLSTRAESLVVTGLAAVTAFALGIAMVRETAVPERHVLDRPIQIADGDYVSSDACQACHPSQFASWRRSYHRTMTQVATPESVATSFDDVRVDEVPGSPMRLQQRGRELWAEFDDPDDQGPTRVGPVSDRGQTGVGPRRIFRQVVMSTGSHNQQIYWYATGHSRVVGQLPAIWLTADSRWIPRRAAVMHPPGQAPSSETGAWNGVCVACHATNGRPAFDTPFGSQAPLAQTADTTAVQFGVACEACHGPGDEHARVNRSPTRRYRLHLTGGADSTIVQPGRLTARRASQVCGQCHAFWEFSDSQAERRANAQGLPYRPGDELNATRFIVQPTTNGDSQTMRAFLEQDPGFIRDIFWSDGMVRATGREYNGLIESPCFKNATDEARTLECSSCHTMHQTTDDTRSLAEWADDQLAPRAGGDNANGACLQCHAKFRANASAHTKHGPDSSGSSCYNCHMPYTTYGLLKTIRSHQISSPSVQATIATGRPNACNLCHLDKTLAWTAGQLTAWYGTATPDLGPAASDERLVAAALLWLLRGDAGQRAIVAQSMGWAPAQRTSGAGWLAPYLALFLDDPYDAVRYIASRSLRSLPEFRGFAYDYVAPPAARAATRIRAMEIWRDARGEADRRGRAEILMNADGTFMADTVNRLVRERDIRRVVYRE
jgi:cytochrome c552/cytochrome c554/c'-like protein